MAQGIHRVDGPERFRPPVVAKASEVFAENSPVTKDSSGLLVVSTAGTKVYGFIKKGFTAMSTNSTGTGIQTTDATAARYAPPVIEPDNVYFWADADQAWTETDNDQYCDVASAAAGVVTLNLAAGATGQFAVQGLLADADPANFSGDTTKIVVKVAEQQDSGFAQT